MATRSGLELHTERLGPLPLVNHFLERLGLDRLLERFVPTVDSRARIAHATALGVLVRSILVEREPIYRHQETVSAFAPEAFGLDRHQAGALADDQLGRALDRLFDADRGGLLTEVIVAVRRRFDVACDELHNDSTTVRFTGQYRAARGRALRGRRAPWITYGHSKDHRPDLKQLLYILTTSADGGVPVQFRCADGQINDAVTHIDTWEALRAIAGRGDFLYVADCKLCTFENMRHLDRHGGRFVTVIPRSRLEDEEFRRWIQTHDPPWELVWDRPHPRRQDGPHDRWWVFKYPIPSREGWPVVWVYSELLALAQQGRRRERIARAHQELEDIARGLASKRSRRRKQAELEEAIDELLSRLNVRPYVLAKVEVEREHRYRQAKAGRPGPTTQYRRITHQRLRVTWTVNEGAVAYDEKSDGMFPLLTNDRSLTPAGVLAAHKRQPAIEKRFEQLKTVHEIAPLFLKNEGRIEAFFVVYFLALVVNALIEREIRRAMAREEISDLPLYPEERPCRRPTTEQILRLFAEAQRHRLYRGDRLLEVFEPQLSQFQQTVLRLLGVPRSAYLRRR